MKLVYEQKNSFERSQIKQDVVQAETRESLEDIQEHSITRSIIYHLLPGAIITLLFFLTAGPIQSAGFPPSFALLICTMVVLLPTLGHLLLEGKKRNGKLSLKGIVLYRQRTLWRQYLWIVPLVTLWGLIVYVLTTPLQLVLISKLFFWWPSLFLTDSGHYSSTNLAIAEITTLIINGLLGPIIEELYFRGYLLPRLARLGKWAPWLNLALFSLYHFWQPWQNLTNLLGLWPFVLIVWKKRDVRLSIVLHCTLNLVGMLLLLGAAHAAH